MPSSPKHLLIVGPSWVGDMVMAQSLFIYIKQHYPDILIDVLAPNWSKPLLAAMPEVNKAIEMPLGHGQLGLSQRFKLGKSLRKRYDWAITLPNSLKSALVPFAAKIPKRTGYKGEMRYGLLNDLHHLDKEKLTMTVQRFVALATGDDITLDDCPKPDLNIDKAEITQLIQDFSLDTNRQILALCPGAEYGSAKCWPAEHFADLAKQYLEKDWQVIVLGSENDKAISEEICKKTNHTDCINLAGTTSLHQAIVLLAAADYVVSNDSGLMHIAAAVDRPLVALYGSSDPTFTPPLNDKASIAYQDLSCSPCFKRECPLGHLDCLTQITPDKVVAIIENHDH